MDNITNGQFDTERLKAELELAKNLALIERIAKEKMSKEAISRYGSLKIAHPEKAVKAISLVAQAVQLGDIKNNLSDEEFKNLLMGI